MQHEQHELVESCTTKCFQTSVALRWKKRLPNALYQIAWHGALNRVTITQCKTRNSRSPVRHKKSDLQCCCNGKECHPFAHWFFAIPFTWVFPSCICSTLSRSEMAACTFLTWKTSRWQSCTYLTNQFGKDWAPKRWADLEVDPNSFSSYPRPNHAGLPGLPWGDTLGTFVERFNKSFRFFACNWHHVSPSENVCLHLLHRG